MRVPTTMCLTRMLFGLPRKALSHPSYSASPLLTPAQPSSKEQFCVSFAWFPFLPQTQFSYGLNLLFCPRRVQHCFLCCFPSLPPVQHNNEGTQNSVQTFSANLRGFAPPLAQLSPFSTPKTPLIPSAIAHHQQILIMAIGQVTAFWVGRNVGKKHFKISIV